LEVFGGVAVVVGKGVGDDGDALGAEGVEEAFGVADAGDGVDAAVGEGLQREGAAAEEGLGVGAVQAHGPFAEGGFGDGLAAAVDDAVVAAGAARGEFAQGAGGDEAAVAVAAAAVDDFDLDVAAQAVVLEAVVADDDVAAGVGKRLGGGGAVAVDSDPGAGTHGDEDGFVAARVRIGAGFDPEGVFVVFAAVAAAGDAGGPAFGAQAFDQGDGERGLAAAAGDEVADDDDGNIDAGAA